MKERPKGLRGGAKDQALLGGGRERIEGRHEAGKLTTRERLDLLLRAQHSVAMGASCIHNPWMKL